MTAIFKILTTAIISQSLSNPFLPGTYLGKDFGQHEL